MGVTRETLYAEVWAEPMTTVAKRYEVSSNFLARVCDRLGVPHPARGYWAQRAAGTKMVKPRLPAAEPGSEIEWVRDGSEPTRQPMVGAGSPQRRRTRGQLPEKHSLLLGVRESFEHAREGRDRDYVRPYKRNLVDIFVSKTVVDRALKVAGELFLALEARGQRVVLAPRSARWHHVSVEVREGYKRKDNDYYYYPRSWTPGQPTIALVKDIAIGLTVFEVSEEVDARYDSTLQKYVRVEPSKASGSLMRVLTPARDEWTSKHWLPSGRLGLHAYAPQGGIKWEKYWFETKQGDFPKLYEAIGADLEHAAPTITKLIEKKKVEDEEWRRKCDAEQREWERKEAERQRAEREAAREKEIVEVIADWRLARDIRAYVAEVEALVKSANLEVTKGGNAEAELKWALAHAERIDPVTDWRKDIESAIAEKGGKPCPKCVKIHDPRKHAKPHEGGRPCTYEPATESRRRRR